MRCGSARAALAAALAYAHMWLAALGTLGARLVARCAWDGTGGGVTSLCVAVH
jgi:hypothetical protein